MNQENNFTQEELFEHIRRLTDTQNSLVEEMNKMRAVVKDDPMLSFKTPDPIKNLPIFNGNKNETQAWIEDTEATLNLFDTYKGTQTYELIVRAVKSKILGEAREALIAAGNFNTWPEIKETLQNCFGEKRDLTSYVQSLFYEQQGNKTLTEFYQTLKKLDTRIKSVTANTEDYKDPSQAMNKFISLLTLTRFVDGLDGPLASHVRSCKPINLDEAFSVLKEYTNAAYRKSLTGSLELEDANTLDDIVLATVVGGVSVDSSPDDMTEGMVLSLLST
ncbi:uncharacterized protein LOC133392700 [Anopheles gambiae]|uniref:uncharacterized protein LOC133392700 n=1 Tax=Anopheles gambiae TaxID=7165 RepID=UPI002AC8F8EF|nr:uncharacterized protein LOC133392700 [Anopheles gambiae]